MVETYGRTQEEKKLVYIHNIKTLLTESEIQHIKNVYPWLKVEDTPKEVEYIKRNVRTKSVREVY